MKNDHLPLIQAMKGRAKTVPGEPSFAPPPRTFEIKHEEIPGLPGRKVGEALSVRVHGKIHQQSADGHAVMHVSSVKPDSQDLTDQEYKKET